MIVRSSSFIAASLLYLLLFPGVSEAKAPVFKSLAGHCALTATGRLYCLNHRGQMKEVSRRAIVQARQCGATTVLYDDKGKRLSSAEQAGIRQKKSGTCNAPKSIRVHNAKSLQYCPFNNGTYILRDVKGELAFFRLGTKGHAVVPRLFMWDGASPRNVANYSCTCAVYKNGKAACARYIQPQAKQITRAASVADYDGGLAVLKRSGKVEVAKAPPLKKIKKLIVHKNNSGGCVLTTRGVVKCWGYNAVGQVGIKAKDDWIKKPVTLKLPTVVKMVHDGDTGCVLTKRQTLHCWGMGTPFEHGISGSKASRPVRLKGISSVVDFSISRDAYDQTHPMLMVLKKDGTIWSVYDPKHHYTAEPLNLAHLVQEVVMLRDMTCYLTLKSTVHCQDAKGTKSLPYKGVEHIFDNHSSGLIVVTTKHVHVIEDLVKKNTPDRSIQLPMSGRAIQKITNNSVLLIRDKKGKVWKAASKAPYQLTTIATNTVYLTSDCILRKQGKQLMYGCSRQKPYVWSNKNDPPFWNASRSHMLMSGNRWLTGLKRQDPKARVESIVQQCVLDGKGQVWCQSRFGFLPVDGANAIKKLFATNRHAIRGRSFAYCGQTKNNTVVCWGPNYTGELSPRRLSSKWRQVKVDDQGRP